MATITDLLTNQMQDELLRLTGTTGQPYQAVTGTVGNPYVHYGAGPRLIEFTQLANAASGSPSVVTTVRAASDASGTGAVTIATFAAITATQVTATGSQAEPPKQAARIPVGKPYLSVLFTFSGSGSITLAVLHNPVSMAAL